MAEDAAKWSKLGPRWGQGGASKAQGDRQLKLELDFGKKLVFLEFIRMRGKSYYLMVGRASWGKMSLSFAKMRSRFAKDEAKMGQRRQEGAKRPKKKQRRSKRKKQRRMFEDVEIM